MEGTYGRNLWKEPGNTSVTPSMADVHTCLVAIRFAGVEAGMSEPAQSNVPPAFDSHSPTADCLRQNAKSDIQFWFLSISQKNLSEMVPSLQPCIDRKLARYLQALQKPVTPLPGWLTTTTEPLPSSKTAGQIKTPFTQIFAAGFRSNGICSRCYCCFRDAIRNESH